jgi:putative ABC transport system permease protein
MLRNYFAAALRNLLRNRAVSLVNIAGLGIAFAAALLIALYVRYERSYEHFIPGHERIYRISESWRQTDGAFESRETTSQKVAAWLPLDFPETEHVVRMAEQWLSVGPADHEFNEQVFEADPALFRLLKLEAVAGDLEHSLDQPGSVAISRSMARKYFGTDDAVGEQFYIERQPFGRVTAVFEDLPPNSHFNFRIVLTGVGGGALSFADRIPEEANSTMIMHVYFALQPGAKIESLRAQIPEFIRRHHGKDFAQSVRYDVLNIADIHLSPDARAAWRPRGNPRALAALTLVGALIVLIAVINFVNLATARAAQRRVEVGVRKLAGARRRELLLQFLGEGLMHVAIATLLAFSLVELMLPAFCALLDPADGQTPMPAVTFDYWQDPVLLGALLGGALLVGLLASLYPAFVMASLRPANVLKSATPAGRGGARLRNTLVTLQFAMLIGLLYATMVIHEQTRFALNNALRINTSQVVIYNLGTEPGSKHGPGTAFIHAAAALPGVGGITRSYSAPTTADLQYLVHVPGGTDIGVRVMPVDFNFFDFYQVPLLAGRALGPAVSADTFELTEASRPVNVIINATAARQLGFSDARQAVGKTLEPFAWQFDWNGTKVPRPDPITVVGVVEDFPIDSVRRAIEPMVFFAYDPAFQMVSIRVAGDRVPETMQALAAAWKKFGQPRAQEGWLLDGYYRKLYADVILQQRTLALFAGCAVFLAALGLFGLSIYTAQRRTKEIGVRKVMGAGTGDIMAMLLWASGRPVLFASLIAWAAGYYLMHRWLEGFAYRVPVPWWWLPAASLLALVVALLTVSAHSYLVARANPVNALRYE